MSIMEIMANEIRLSTKNEKPLHVELYKDDHLILSSENSKKTEILSANEGEQANIVFDLSRNSFSFTVSDWGTVAQYVTIG